MMARYRVQRVTDISSVKEEIIVNESGDMVIRKDKLVILRNLLQPVLSLAHEGHQGFVK